MRIVRKKQKPRGTNSRLRNEAAGKSKADPDIS
jgi:hypothetical protein